MKKKFLLKFYILIFNFSFIKAAVYQMITDYSVYSIKTPIVRFNHKYGRQYLACHQNKEKEVMKIYADHWLYHYIPHHQDELLNTSCFKKMIWALFGNDDDGIFGEGPKSGRQWLEKWGGQIQKEEKIYYPGKICFKRFVSWQLRNPLHNFTAYVIGFKHAKKLHFTQLFLLTTQQISFCHKLDKGNVFPMQKRSGIYMGLHNSRPFLSMRINFLWKRLESYAGWRPDGAFGLSFRFKSLSDK